jgi:hypothetical protein
MSTPKGAKGALRLEAFESGKLFPYWETLHHRDYNRVRQPLTNADYSAESRSLSNEERKQQNSALWLGTQ